MRRKKGFFSISAVAKMFSVHQQTIRLYEKQGFLTPERSSGNTRLFSEEDIDRLEEIIYLTHQLRINLAGVEMILKLKKQIEKMKKNVNQMFDATQKELELESDAARQIAKENAVKLLHIKQQAEKKAHGTSDEQSTSVEPIDIDKWEIEYDDE